MTTCDAPPIDPAVEKSRAIIAGLADLVHFGEFVTLKLFGPEKPVCEHCGRRS